MHISTTGGTPSVNSPPVSVLGLGLNGTLGGGLDGDFLLTVSTVHDDAAIDTLYGEGGSDWFFALLGGTTKDAVKDQATGEIVTAL